MLDLVITDGAVSVDGHDTVPKLFRTRVAQWGDRLAMREKDLGIWKAHSWNDFNTAARKIAATLIDDGFQPGDVAAIPVRLITGLTRQRATTLRF